MRASKPSPAGTYRPLQPLLLGTPLIESMQNDAGIVIPPTVHITRNHKFYNQTTTLMLLSKI